MGTNSYLELHYLRLIQCEITSLHKSGKSQSLSAKPIDDLNTCCLENLHVRSFHFSHVTD